MLAAWVRSVFAIGLLGSALSACTSPVDVMTGSGTLEIVSGSEQSGELGATLALPFIAIVKDASREPVAGVTVVFEVTSGGGTLSATSVTTDAMGQAQATLTLGSVAGVNTVAASAPGVVRDPVTFSAIAVPP